MSTPRLPDPFEGLGLDRRRAGRRVRIQLQPPQRDPGRLRFRAKAPRRLDRRLPAGGSPALTSGRTSCEGRIRFARTSSAPTSIAFRRRAGLASSNSPFGPSLADAADLHQPRSPG